MHTAIQSLKLEIRKTIFWFIQCDLDNNGRITEDTKDAAQMQGITDIDFNRIENKFKAGTLSASDLQ